MVIEETVSTDIEHGSSNLPSISSVKANTSNRSSANFDESETEISFSDTEKNFPQKRVNDCMGPKPKRSYIRSKRTDPPNTTKHVLTFILLTLPFIQAPPIPSNGPELFGKGQQLDKLILKNQIGLSVGLQNEI